MHEQSVCAVVITYHPSPEMVAHTAKVMAQVQGLIVVDNGSTMEELAPLREAAQREGFKLIENGENLGIAEALNRGIEWALKEGYPWVILFDQDSEITEGFIDNLFATWEAHPMRDAIGSLQPKYIDPDTGAEARVWRAADGGPVVSMTSGSLMPAWIFERIGLFASEFFIDEVDREYCFRIRAAGYLVADSRSAVLLHSAGEPEPRKLLGFVFRPSNHSPVRRYYSARNRLFVYKRYFRTFPGWILQAAWDDFRELSKTLIGERDRGRKFRSVVRGVLDAVSGTAGKWDGH